MKQDSSAIYVGKASLSLNISNPHDYAQASHIYEILGEATKILLRKSGILSSQVINEFLQQCNKGEHVLLKSYSSFSKSAICKMCFLYNFVKIFDVDQTQRNGLDYYQLSRLLCSDFPRQFIQKTAALLLPNQQSHFQMYKPIPHKNFQQTIYLFMIYTEYFEILQSYFKEEEQLDFLSIYRIFKEEDSKNMKELSKPPFCILAQVLLNLMKEKGLLLQQQSTVLFVTEQNIEDFIKDAESNTPNQTIKFNEILKGIIQSQEYVKLVTQNLQMFENSQVWAVENHKILSARQPIEPPLNVKKKGSKK